MTLKHRGSQKPGEVHRGLDKLAGYNSICPVKHDDTLTVPS